MNENLVREYAIASIAILDTLGIPRSTALDIFTAEHTEADEAFEARQRAVHGAVLAPASEVKAEMRRQLEAEAVQR